MPQVLGISGTATGFIISTSTLWGALTDPVMGYIFYHTNVKIMLGRRFFYIFLGAVELALIKDA